MRAQLEKLLEMKDNRINGLEKRVFELKAQLAEANGLLDEVEAKARTFPYMGLAFVVLEMFAKRKGAE